MVIKPDAVEAGHVEDILEKLRENGMEIVQTDERFLSDEDAREMYKQHEEEVRVEHVFDQLFINWIADSFQSWFEDLIEMMTRGPCVIAIVTKGATGEDVVPELRKLVGPTDAEQAKEEEPESLRAQYGTSKLMNGVHAADSMDQAAQYEQKIWMFP